MGGETFVGRLGMEGVTSARSALWRRLIGGEVSEVFAVSARGLTVDLPRTLGLEPISFDAYIYDRDGVARDSGDLERIAGELAAQPRWICNYGPLFWSRHFAVAAQAILIFPYSFRTASPHAARPTTDVYLPNLVSLLLAEFPDKTLWLKRGHLKILRSVRALPQERR